MNGEWFIVKTAGGCGCAGIYARPLGNVVYMMATPTTAKSRCDLLLQRLLASL